MTTALVVIAGLALLAWKIGVPLAKGEARELGVRFQFGGIGTIIGFLIALIWGAGREISRPSKNEDPPEKIP